MVLASILLAVGFGNRGEALAQPGISSIACSSVAAELGYPSYWAGPSFDGLDLETVIRQCGTVAGEPGYDDVTFIYGECTPRGGGCHPPVEIQSWPAKMRRKEMYGILPGEPHPGDTTVDGVPAIRYDPRTLEIYHPDSTVVIFANEPERVGRFAQALMPAPSRLVELAAFGLYFDRDCVDDPGYCQADRSLRSQDADFLLAMLLFWGLPLGIPLLVALITGRFWVLFLPVLVWPLHYAAMYMGWWGGGLGESWQFGLALGVLAGIVATGLVLVLRVLALSLVHRRRRAAS